MEIEDHDYVFWCGDFNYRIDYANHEIRDMVKTKSWYELQCADQLTVQRNENKVSLTNTLSSCALTVHTVLSAVYAALDIT